MKRLQLSYIGHLSDRVQELYYGTVQPEGIDLHFIPAPPVEAFNRMLQGEFHCGEMSFSTYTIRLARSKAAGQAMPFVAIPVFPSRTFRHGAIYVNRRAGITKPEHLKGRRVGVPEYQMTAAVWTRGMLKHEYGVDPKDIQWVTGGIKDPGRKPMVDLSIPGVEIRHEEHKTLNDMLLSGEIEALIAPQMPPAIRDGREEVSNLFADVPTVEREYYRKTGLFPTMHVVVLRRELYEQHPWAAVSLFKAFEQAKDNCLRGLSVEEPLPVSMPWIYQFGKSVRELMGPDYWPYGIEKNRKEIEAVCQYTWEQGLVPAKVDPAELFAPAVVNLSGNRRL
jgi:4,5-dihydroxyphthalate decarboxylase